jgi:hypothetical protein
VAAEIDAMLEAFEGRQRTMEQSQAESSSQPSDNKGNGGDRDRQGTTRAAGSEEGDSDSGIGRIFSFFGAEDESASGVEAQLQDLRGEGEVAPAKASSDGDGQGIRIRTSTSSEPEDSSPDASVIFSEREDEPPVTWRPALQPEPGQTLQPALGEAVFVQGDKSPAEEPQSVKSSKSEAEPAPVRRTQTKAEPQSRPAVAVKSGEKPEPSKPAAAIESEAKAQPAPERADSDRPKVEPKPKETKPVAPKSEEPKPAEPEPAEPKPEEPKPSELKPVEPKAEEAKPAEPKPAEPKPEEPKPAEPKPEEPKPEQPKSEEPKSEEPKSEEPKPEEPKSEEPKQPEPKPAEPKPAESKPEEPKPEEPKSEEPKSEEPKQPEPKPAEPKPAEPKPEEPKPAESKLEEPKPAELKPAEPKPAEPKPAEPEPEEPKLEEPKLEEPKPEEPKPAEPKPEEPKPEEPKPAEPKPEEPKPEEPKPAEPKPAEPKPAEPDQPAEPPEEPVSEIFADDIPVPEEAVFGLRLVEESFNHATHPNPYTAQIGIQVFASPIRFDRSGNPQPYLAREWELSDDRLTLTLKLDERARFHDGRPVAALDLSFTLEWLMRIHPMPWIYAPIKGIEAADRHTLVLHFKYPHPALFQMLSPYFFPVLPSHAYNDGESPAQHPSIRAPVGAGPYRFVEYLPGERVVLEAFDKYEWGAKPAIPRLVYKLALFHEDLLQAIKYRQLDRLAMVQPGAARDEATSLPQLQLLDLALPVENPEIHLRMNARQAPLDKPQVRKAIAWALGSMEWRRQIWGEDAIAPQAGNEGELIQANRWLDETGLPRGADGVRFVLTLGLPDWMPELEMALYRHLRERLAETLGIVVKEHFPDNEGKEPGLGSATISNLSIHYLRPWSKELELLHLLSEAEALEQLPEESLGEARALVEAALSETDTSKREEQLQNAEQILEQERLELILARLHLPTLSHRGLGASGEEYPARLFTPLDHLGWDVGEETQ